ncbi:MAG TPA: thioesterase family protein [Candidatus Acidoferrales bacterium]|nr:thioesterase family protein [Candidatus Acidoferrales bacterium]
MTTFGETTIRVRYAETDQMGVVYYANFFVWFEVARVEFMRQLGFSYKQMEIEDDSFVVVAKANCTYKHPAKFDDVARIRTEIADSRKRTITFRYEVFKDAPRVLLATGETLHVICDGHGRPKSLPEKYRKYFPLTHAANAVTERTAD